MGDERSEQLHLSRDILGGWHSIYRRADGRLVVEWLEYRDPALYDHATRLIFTSEQEAELRQALAASNAQASTPSVLAGRFDTYWAVRSFADANALAYQAEVDFQP